MSEIRCTFRAHYKHNNIGFYDLGEFSLWLPEKEAYNLLNDSQGRLCLFFMHYPTATVVDRNVVTMELHEKR